jgi:PAS domain S-box-containing protein
VCKTHSELVIADLNQTAMSPSTSADAHERASFESVPASVLLRELFDKADIGMALADVNTRRFLRVNAKLCQLTGYSEKELLNTSAVALTHPDDRSADEESFKLFAQGQIDRRVVEKRYLRRDGTTVWVHITTTFVQLGNIRCSFGITEDITERHAALASLRAAERRKNHFLAMLGHELRNPLAAIRNSTEILLSLPHTDELFGRVRGVIDRQSQNLERLVDDLLDSARITAGKIKLNKRYVGVAEVIQEALEMVDHELRARGHVLSVSLPAQDVSLYGDKLRLIQIFANLLTNAIKYTPEGGRIDVQTTVEASDLIVAITDSGVGIAADQMSSIFKLFEQAEHNVAGTNSGLGLGLAITKRLVELHGGTIDVRSYPGLGSTFKVRLAHENRRMQPVVRKPNISAGKARIAIVEDNADVAETMALVLSASGHECRLASDGASALKLIEKEWPDVFLIDLGLPDMHGHDLVQQLRARDHSNAAYMIAVSGHAHQSDIQRSLEAGFDKHLVKPVDFDALLAIVAADRRLR